MRAKVVPFLSEDEIEQDAALLLAEFVQSRNVVIESLIPIEDILEKHLKLAFEFADTHEMFGLARDHENEADILGAIIFEERRVVIDQSLDPEEDLSKEGRYRFTLAHEIGHWRLHRRLFFRDLSQGALFDEPTRPTVICRSSQAKEPIEWQADTFASSLLMPAPLVRYWWRELYSRSAPLIFEVFERDLNWSRPPVGWRSHALATPRGPKGRFDPRCVEYFFFRAASPLAEKFGVSVQAMQVRLERLGLLLLQRPAQLTAAGF